MSAEDLALTGRETAGLRWTLADALLRRRVAIRGLSVSLMAIALVATTHDLPYLLSTPVWGDEAWIVVTRLFPLADLPSLTSSAPIAWNLLAQGFSGLGDTGARLLVQLFNAAAVVAAFYVGRSIPLRPEGIRRDVVGLVAAASVALAPLTLLRVDIKHYSADAFVALLALYLTLRAAEHPRSRWLFGLTALSVIGLLFAFATLFVAAAAFGTLLLVALYRRDRGATTRVLLHGVVAAAVLGAVYLVFYAKGDIPSLQHFWSPLFPTILDLPRFLAAHLILVDEWVLFSSVWIIVPLVGIALFVLYRQRSWPAFVFLPLLFATMVTLGLLRRYPLLDPRTSTFFLVLTSLFAGLGALWIVTWLFRVLVARITRGSPGRWASRVAPLLGTLTVLGVMSGMSVPYLRAHSLPTYDTTYQSDYVASHLGPHDLVLFNDLASYQVGLSWRLDTPDWCADPEAWTGFYICYPNSSRLAGFGSLDEAYRMIDNHLARHPGSRVWLIRSSVFVDYEQMERELPGRYDYEVIDLPIQPVGVVNGRHE